MNKPQLETPSISKGTKTFRMEEMYPVMLEVFQHDGSFSLTITGSSMFPTILGGRDKVTLRKPPVHLNKLDLPLYRRKNGQFVLHRIVAVEQDGSYTCCGDHQWILEKGILPEQIVGIVTDIVRKGKSFGVDNRHYCRWVRLWHRLLWARKAFFAVYYFASRVKGLFRAALRKLFRKSKSKTSNAEKGGRR